VLYSLVASSSLCYLCRGALEGYCIEKSAYPQCFLLKETLVKAHSSLDCPGAGVFFLFGFDEICLIIENLCNKGVEGKVIGTLLLILIPRSRG